MGVEQQGLASGSAARSLANRSLPPCVRPAGRACRRPRTVRASRRHGTAAAPAAGRLGRARTSDATCIDEQQQHRRHEGRQRRGQLAGAVQAHMARALGVQHEAQRVGTGAATASSTSASRVRPQILMRVRAHRSGSGQPVHAAGVCRARHVRHRSTAPGNTGRRGERWAPPHRGCAPASTSASQPGGLAPAAHRHQAAHHVAHHVVQEGTAVEVEAPVGTAAV
jgi:hypothetical protein